MSGPLPIACGPCRFAFFDLYFPPVLGWVAPFAGWYLVASIVRGVRDGNVVTNTVTSLLLSILFAGCASFFGPPAFIALAAPSIYAAASGRERELRPAGAFALAVAALIGFHTAAMLYTRTDVDFVRPWRGSGPASVVADRLPEPLRGALHREMSGEPHVVTPRARRHGRRAENARDLAGAPGAIQ